MTGSLEPFFNLSRTVAHCHPLCQVPFTRQAILDEKRIPYAAARQCLPRPVQPAAPVVLPVGAPAAPGFCLAVKDAVEKRGLRGWSYFASAKSGTLIVNNKIHHF